MIEGVADETDSRRRPHEPTNDAGIQGPIDGQVVVAVVRRQSIKAGLKWVPINCNRPKPYRPMHLWIKMGAQAIKILRPGERSEEGRRSPDRATKTQQPRSSANNKRDMRRHRSPLREARGPTDGLRTLCPHLLEGIDHARPAVCSRGFDARGGREESRGCGRFSSQHHAAPLVVTRPRVVDPLPAGACMSHNHRSRTQSGPCPDPPMASWSPSSHHPQHSHNTRDRLGTGERALQRAEDKQLAPQTRASHHQGGVGLDPAGASAVTQTRHKSRPNTSQRAEQ